MNEPAVLGADEWQERAAAHARRADALTHDARERKAHGHKHAVEDFLYEYYNIRPARLRRWHPGLGVRLALPVDSTGADETTSYVPAHTRERAGWRWYRVTCLEGRPEKALEVDGAAFLADRLHDVENIDVLLTATAHRPAQFGCFGLHEWAMVYQDEETGRAHRHPLPLRLGSAKTDEVVRAETLRCTHFDAYRFFTPEAVPLSSVQPTRETQAEWEQGGCLHANMDLYKWAAKLGPAVPGELLLDAFELALEIRYLDMRASAYDVSSYGLENIPVETTEGKAAYVREQRAFASRATAIRDRIREITGALLASGTATAAIPAAGGPARPPQHNRRQKLD